MHELVVIGAGLAGCSLLAQPSCGYDANIAVVEAERDLVAEPNSNAAVVGLETRSRMPRIKSHITPASGRGFNPGSIAALW